MQSSLNEEFLSAEKLMALRQTDMYQFNNIIDKIDEVYNKLIKALSSAVGLSETIEAV